MNKTKYSEQRDEETGYVYFGARYMDHELMTMWLSVDPMADKYPKTHFLPLHELLLLGTKDGAATHIPTHKSHIQPTLRTPQKLVPYCVWIPVKLVDPDGRESDKIKPVYKYVSLFAECVELLLSKTP